MAAAGSTELPHLSGQIDVQKVGIQQASNRRTFSISFVDLSSCITCFSSSTRSCRPAASRQCSINDKVCVH